MLLLRFHSIPFLLRTLPRADMESAPTVCQSRCILPAANFGGVGAPRPTSYQKGERRAASPLAAVPASGHSKPSVQSPHPRPAGEKPPLSKGGAEPARRRDSCPSAGVTAHKAQPVGIPPSACGVHLLPFWRHAPPPPARGSLSLTREAFLPQP